MTITDLRQEVLGGRYALQEIIAVGAMGEVWRGRDTLFDRPVAVKVLRNEYAGDPAFAARFRAEAQHAAALSHPNIAAVHDYGEASSASTGEHLAYLVMELVEGEPLSARLAEEGPLPPADALSVLRQASAALAEAHRAGVVHRDVKPANILLRTDGTVKLTDFGIASSAGSVPLTRTGQVIGTPQYMAPERAMGEPAGPASDVYSLGLVGYECLTGRAAFTGDNPVTIALAQVQTTPDPLPADVPDDVRTLVDAALVKDPEARIPDGDSFLHAVEDTIDGRAVPTGQATREILVAPSGLPRRHRHRRWPDAPGRRRGARRAWLWAVPLVLVLLAVGVVALVLGQSGSDRPAGGASPPARAPAAAPTAAGIVLAAGDYVGRPADDVVGELTALGLTVDRSDEVAPDAAPGTVTGVDPAGVALTAGDRVRLSVALAPPAAPTHREADSGAPVTGTGRTAARPAPDTRSAPPAGSTAPAPAATASEPAVDPTTSAGTTTDPRIASSTNPARGTSPSVDATPSAGAGTAEQGGAADGSPATGEQGGAADGSPATGERGRAADDGPTTAEQGRATDDGPTTGEEDATTESSAPGSTSAPTGTDAGPHTDVGG